MIREAIARNQTVSAYYSNLAAALQTLNRFDEALASYDEALRIEPALVEAHSNRGNTLRELGRFEDALASYDAALHIKPDYAEAYLNRGNTLKSAGRPTEALASYDTALHIKPTLVEAHYNRGVVLAEYGRSNEALSAYEAALRLKPNYVEAHSNRGNALKDLGRADEAISSYDAAICIKPDYAEAYSNRGNALREFSRLDEALSSYDAALRIKPGLAETHSNRGTALAALGRLEEALTSYEAALRIRPDLVEAHSNLILDLHYEPGPGSNTIQAATRRFGMLYKPVSPAFENTRDPDRRLRIGYVSGDFRRHSVSYFMAPVLANHNAETVELFCYASHLHDDEMTARLRSSADCWRSLVGLTDEDAEMLIRRDAIDILVDLSGHTAANRLPLFALKPAPVQVTWLGFPGSTGLAAIDYRLVDMITDPEDEVEGWASETLCRLPGGFLCFDPPAEAPAVAPPPGLGRPITFGSFNNPAKLSAATLDAWAALLASVPQARLLLKGRPLKDETARQLLLERFRSRGVTPDRLSLQGWMPGPEGHLGLYGQVDIALDPFPYNGTTTTCEALWMGVPVLTLTGTQHSGRVGTSLLTRLGLPELIAPDTDAYLRIAIDLATDLKRLTNLRQSLRQRMAVSPLCNGPAFTRDLEAAYRAMWRNWCLKAAE